MTDINMLLREADPARHEDALSFDEAQGIRQAMLVAAREEPVAVPLWRRPLALATVATLTMVLAGITGHRAATKPAGTAGPTGDVLLPASGAVAGDDRRQLQFATPGGTRIIWIFDQSLHLQESMP